LGEKERIGGVIMEFPELLSVLLYKDCGAEVTSDLPRLQTLATANGKNPTLVLYLLFFKKTGRCPNPTELVSFGNTVPQFSIEQIADELELADAINKQGNAGYEMEFAQAWEKAHDLYVSHGHQVASALLQQIIPQDIDKRKIIKLFGEDQANWKWAEYAKVWWTEYDAANPFVKRQEEEKDPANEHEYVFATGVDASGDEVENTTLTVINATDIKPEQLNWLWPERIPQGTICWFTGKPNLGKSLATLDLIARVTTGRDWPDGERNTVPPQDVMIAISEDGLANTVIPRLNAAGADLSHIKFFHRVKLDKGSRHLQLSCDTSALKRGLEANPSVTLVVLDPLESFSGDVNININQEIRPVMDALSAVCNKTHVTVIGIVHDNKRSDVSAIQKIPGGSSVAGAARSAFGFSRDPDNQNEFYMALVKGNLSKKRTGLKYTIGEKTVGGISAPHIVWGEEHENTADDLLNAERDTGGRKDKKQIELAKDFLQQALASGPRQAKELFAESQTLAGC
jgi:RecA-family ATPase